MNPTTDKRFLVLELVLLGLIVLGTWNLPEQAGRLLPESGLPHARTIVIEADYGPCTGGSQKITGLNAEKTLTVPAAAFRCLFYVEDDSVRWTDDGTSPDPATKVGAEITAGQYLSYAGDLDAIKLKGTAATIVHVFYYKM